jgi:hypothetical protein
MRDAANHIFHKPFHSFSVCHSAIPQTPKYEAIEDQPSDSAAVRSARWWANYTARNQVRAAVVEMRGHAIINHPPQERQLLQMLHRFLQQQPILYSGRVPARKQCYFYYETKSDLKSQPSIVFVAIV